MLGETWNNILPGVQDYIKNDKPEQYKQIKQTAKLKISILDNLIKNSNIFDTQDEISVIIIEYLCYFDRKLLN